MTLARRFNLEQDRDFRVQVRMRVWDFVRDYGNRDYNSSPAVDTEAERIEHKIRLDYNSRFLLNPDEELEKFYALCAANIDIVNDVTLDPLTNKLSVDDNDITPQVRTAFDVLAEVSRLTPTTADPDPTP